MGGNVKRKLKTKLDWILAFPYLFPSVPDSIRFPNRTKRKCSKSSSKRRS